MATARTRPGTHDRPAGGASGPRPWTRRASETRSAPGLLAARQRGLPWEVAGRVGSVAAVYALETVGAQPRRYSMGDFLDRYRENFGNEGAHGTVDRLRAGA